VYGPPTIAVLHKYNVPATFFVVGVRVKQNPELVREMVADGDEIGNHTFDHTRLAPLPPHEIAHELEDDDINIFRAAGVHTTVMRPPGVQYNTKVLRVCKALGYVTVSWNVAAKDYLPVSPDFITDHVLAKIDNGSIILLHQDTPFTVKALPRIITVLRARGYRFVTIDTLLAHLGVQPYAGELHDDAVPTAAPASEPAKFHNTGLGAGGSE
jgi:peptidoglycan/xylan/chitin deacetylase (PgdA/CDA1 family)